MSILVSTSVFATAKQSTLSMTITNDHPTLTLRPGNFGKTDNTIISASTDNYSGYSLSVASTKTTSLVNDDDYEIASIANAVSETTFSTDSAYDDKWGYRPNQYFADNSVIQNNNFLPAPSLSGTTIDVTNAANASSNDYTLSFAAKISEVVPVGAYTYTYVTNLVANALNYNIVYDKNTDKTVSDMPDPNPQVVNIDGATPVEDSYATLSDATPTMAGKRFGGWCDVTTTVDPTTGDYVCDGETYQVGDDYPIDQTAGPNITLYAIWINTLASEYAITYHYGDITFTGSNYLNTRLHLFSADSFDTANESYQDFELNFTIENDRVNVPGMSNNRNVLASCLEEVSPDYAGFDFRYLTNNNYFQMEANSNKSRSEMRSVRHDPPQNTLPWSNVSIRREGTKLYFGDSTTPDMDYANIAKNTDVPLTFGAQISTTPNMKRFYKGTLSDITAKLMYDTYSTVRLPEPALSDEFFVGWSTTPDGNNKVSSITVEGNVDLYAVWRSEIIDGYTVTYDYGDMSFDGTQYFNTNISLFSNELYQNDFEIKGDIRNLESLSGQNQNYNTIVSNMDESATPWPGFVYRFGTNEASGSNRGYTIAANSTSSNKKTVLNSEIDSSRIDLYRINKILYLDNDYKVLDFSDLVKTFDSPLVFGATLDGQSAPMRYLKADLNNVEVEMQYAKGQAVTLPQPNFVNSGCTFLGWTGDNGDTPQLSITIPADNVDDVWYKANFDCTHTTITFDANGGNASETTRQVAIGGSIGTLPTATRTGFAFDGWYYDKDSFVQPVSATDIPVTNTTVYAKWSAIQYAITFDSDGGTPVETIRQTYNTTITPPAAPTKAGYDFVRWDPALPAKMPIGGKTLVAVWRDESISDYLVTFDYGSIDFDSGTSYINTNLQLFSDNFFRNDFSITTKVESSTFIGNTDGNFNSVFSAIDESGTGNAYPGIVFRRNASNFRLAANADAAANKYEVNYNNQTITVARASDRILLNSNQIVDMASLVRTFNTPLTFGASLKADGTPFRYFKGELSGTRVTTVYDNEHAVSIPDPAFINSGCVFTGWTGSNGNIPETNITIPAGNTDDMTYTANFDCS